MTKITFYFDRNFGKSLPEAIRQAKPLFGIEYQHDRKGKYKFKQGALDDEWLPVIGNEGWFVFSHDRKFNKTISEYKAIMQYKVGCFILWGSNASTWDKLKSFVKASDRILDIAANKPRPFIYEVTKQGKLKEVDLSEVDLSRVD